MAKTFFKDRYKEKKGGEKKPPKFDIPGPKRAAIMMVALGKESSSLIFQNLSDSEVEAITTEISTLKDVSAEMKDDVMQNFHQLAIAQQFVAQGGIEYAQEVLEKALGPRRAREVLERVQNAIRKTGFNLLEGVNPNQLVNFIQKEHPQTIALLLAHIDAVYAAPILSALPQELQVDVATRIATMESISPEVLNEVEGVLSSSIKNLFGGDVSEIGGVKSVAEILNFSDRGSEKNILGNLERENPELATEIKNLMFVFEDVLLIDDRSMQRLMKEVDTKGLGLALKGGLEEVKVKFFKNMSQRAAEMINDDMEFMGPVRLKDVEEAQQTIVDVIRRLEDEGEIVISGRGGDDEIVV